MEVIEEKHDPYASLKIKEFRLFLSARFITTLATQMQALIVGWQIYEITKDPFSLGLIGLAEAIPFMCMAMFAGHFADIFNRRKIILFTVFLYFLCACALMMFTLNLTEVLNSFGTLPIYLVVGITGFARATVYPAQMAFVSQIVPRKLYPNSSTWNSTAWHIAAVAGPALGGIIYGFFGITKAYITVMILVSIGILLYSGTKNKAIPPNENNESIIQSLSKGIKFVSKNQIILGSLSLDMFAVLFGGAVAMLPVFAAEILHTGPQGLGFLRAAPAIGAVIMSIILAYYPPVKKTGKKLLYSVACFGICIILFAISQNIYLSIFLLMMSGMFDNVSYVIRQTIIQIYTPDNMRGRVAAINSVFIGSSNEIGSFESGLAAKIMGLIPSVIFGGSMTLVVVSITAKVAPILRKMKF
ncbi:MAG: MFS transporter [Bacteroidetes bacterium]|nr:MFS transporter [Bacteroidota bacterium]